MTPLASAASAALLLIAPFDKPLFTTCLSSSFYGSYRAGLNTYHSVFMPDATCFDSFAVGGPAAEAHVMEFTRTERELVWVEKEVVEASLTNAEKESMDDFFKHFGYIHATVPNVGGQQAFSGSSPHPLEVLHQTPDALLLSVPSAEAYGIDLILPRFWKSTILPSSPVEYIPVPFEDVEPIRNVLGKLRFDPVVASIVNNISLPQMKDDVRFLTGEDGKSGIVSRHSFTPGAIVAANWIKARIEESGAKCELWTFITGFTPNVICRYESTVPSDTRIIVSGHYDSRGSFGSTRAPGGDDDGSGTTSLLAIARTIGRKGLKFHTNVELIAFGGEEQGRLGSIAYARKLKVEGEKIALVVQADMLAYRAPDEPLQLGLPETIGTPEATQLVANISAIYSPELIVGYSAACCSDHQSFYDVGYPGTQVFERAGPIADPMYHNSGDLSDREGYSFEQLYGISKVQFATLLHMAGFELPK
ncbi:Zn-dependent exopeptidase [Macrolepiota fuliginosa MF-IS2]|uniref:Peptide hydrolase n=1 Tax=Macrolepiota fuliginosa MF-IS2 TaxID=1400762 RepID=A0A9P5XJD7_9AGAR|nr:Zn-dependent exopeptidase [Macrolepiota fuliginosa MF-IS2]